MKVWLDFRDRSGDVKRAVAVLASNRCSKDIRRWLSTDDGLSEDSTLSVELLSGEEKDEDSDDVEVSGDTRLCCEVMLLRISTLSRREDGFLLLAGSLFIEKTCSLK